MNTLRIRPPQNLPKYQQACALAWPSLGRPLVLQAGWPEWNRVTANQACEFNRHRAKRVPVKRKASRRTPKR